MVLSPEHPLVDTITTPEQKDAVETIKEEEGEYIYETPHFRFICDAKLGAGTTTPDGYILKYRQPVPR